MKKFLTLILCLLPLHAGADVVYRMQRVGSVDYDGELSESFASKHRFYIGGTYDFSLWQDFIDDTTNLHGRETHGFGIVGGVRVSDTFRVEADYMNTRAEWRELDFRTNSLFVNAILDARIDAPYRLFYDQSIVPYVGVGGGVTWIDSDLALKDAVVSMAALVGIAFELGEYVAVDFGYRYIYMCKPAFDVAPGLTPRAHQFRAGLRINF